MKAKTVFLALLICFITASDAIAYTATGTISGRIISTSIVVNNQNLGNIVANNTVYYYWNGSALSYVEDNTTASDVYPFAIVDFATDSGYVEVAVGTNKSLPSTAKILIDNDKTPNESTLADATQIQITGNGNTAQLTYQGENGDGRIAYTSDGMVYVFINTGDAATGDINVDIVVTAT
jgi:hypothetical protein